MGKARLGATWVGILLALGALSPVFAGEVSSVSIAAGSTGTRAEILLEGSGEYRTISLAGPDRLVVDLPASRAARSLRLPAGSGIIQSVRTGQPSADTLRIVFDLSAPVALLSPRMEPTATGAKLVLEWPGEFVTAKPQASNPAGFLPGSSHRTAAAATAALTAAVAQQASAPSRRSPQDILNGQSPALPASVPARQAPAASVVANARAVAANAAAVPAPEPYRPLPQVPMRKGMRPLVVAIDAGHGGQDPGAIGPTGKREKDVTLAMARELARQINATAGMKAFLVRDGDFFISLPQRAQRARAGKADIFVSIHADAAENRNARGSSVYVLSLKGASSQRARWLADKENASDLVGGVRLQQVDNTLSSVLLDLAQSGHMKASEDAANNVLDGLKRVGNNHKPNIERANFAVLRTSDMPSMLVETAFISNAEEEQRLIDPAFQRKVAGAVLDGVVTYFSQQPPPGTVFAARAQAAEAAAGATASLRGSSGAP
ncbi:MAG: N-acetylmuramoyl-L-alanine amidase [Pseudoxanthomonas sp.]|nr:N-acetylmuramoyl-L-alanine amidase [Pseudoxanthomonas sp.]